MRQNFECELQFRIFLQDAKISECINQVERQFDCSEISRSLSESFQLRNLYFFHSEKRQTNAAQLRVCDTRTESINIDSLEWFSPQDIFELIETSYIRFEKKSRD